jgi:cell division protein ZapE
VTVKKIYQAELLARGYHADPAQLRAVQVLETCSREWGKYREQRSNALKKLINRPPIPRGV